VSTVSTRRYSSNTTADPVGLDASPGGWKWERGDATPSVRRCYQVGAHGYSWVHEVVRRRVEGRASRRSAVAALQATSRAFTYERIRLFRTCNRRARAGRLRSADALTPVGCGHAGTNDPLRHSRSHCHTRTANKHHARNPAAAISLRAAGRRHVGQVDRELRGPSRCVLRARACVR
jgi:hypothetical protein